MDEQGRERLAAEVSLARRSGGGLRSLARSMKLDVKTQADLPIGSPLPSVPTNPELARQLTSLRAGALGDPIITTAGIVLVNVTSRNDHSSEFDAQKDSIRDNLLRQRQDRIYRAFLKRLRDAGSVVVNDAVVRALDRAS